MREKRWTTNRGNNGNAGEKTEKTTGRQHMAPVNKIILIIIFPLQTNFYLFAHTLIHLRATVVVVN